MKRTKNNFEFEEHMNSLAMPCRICIHGPEKVDCEACSECVFVEASSMDVIEWVYDAADGIINRNKVVNREDLTEDI